MHVSQDVEILTIVGVLFGVSLNNPLKSTLKKDSSICVLLAQKLTRGWTGVLIRMGWPLEAANRQVDNSSVSPGPNAERTRACLWQFWQAASFVS